MASEFPQRGAIRNGGTGRELAWVAGPKILNGTLQVATGLLLLRVLGPEEFGLASVAIAAVLLGDAVLGSALDTGVLRLVTGAADPHSPEAFQVQKAALVFKLAAAALLAAGVAAWSGPLNALLFQGRGRAGLLLLTVWAILGTLVLRSVQTCFQAGRSFPRYGAADLLQCALKYGGIAVLLLSGAATAGRVVLCYALGPLLMGAMFLATICRPILTSPWASGTAARLFRVVRWYLGAIAVGSITTRMDLFFVSALAGTAAAGIYSAAQAAILGFQLLGMYLGVVFAPRILPLWRAGSLPSVYWRFQAAAGGAAAVIYVAALAAAKPIGAHLFPALFQQATGVLLLLLPAALLALVNFPWTVSLLLFSRPACLLLIDGAALPLLAAAYSLAIRWYGAPGAAVVAAVFAVLKTALLQALAWQTLRRGCPAAELSRRSAPPAPLPVLAGENA